MDITLEGPLSTLELIGMDCPSCQNEWWRTN
jgi:hypothetical protein